MQTLEKRSSEQVRFDIVCSRLLTAGETITSVGAISCSPTTTPPLTFGTPVVNTVASTYYDQFGAPYTAPIGTVVQLQISGGKIPSTGATQDYIVRVMLVTSVNPAVEATVRLRLNDTPAP